LNPFEAHDHVHRFFNIRTVKNGELMPTIVFSFINFLFCFVK